MRSFYIDQSTGDLTFDNLKRLKMVEGDDEDCQAIWLELSTGLGEWFLNRDGYGVPWWQLLDQQASLELIKAEVLKAIMRTGRVHQITSLEISVDNRQATITFEGILINGNIASQSFGVVI